MNCRQVMTADPACCVPQDSVVTAAMIMKAQNAGSVPVVADRNSRHVVGIVTDRDIAIRVVAEQRDYYSTHVADVMSKDVVTCKEDDDYDQAIAAMKEHQIRRIPVVDAGKGLVGIVAMADVSRQAEPRIIGEAMEEISEPSGATERDWRQQGGAANYAMTSLLVAGGIGLGAGLIYLLDPRWARRAREAVDQFTGSGKRSSTEDANQ